MDGCGSAKKRRGVDWFGHPLHPPRPTWPTHTICVHIYIYAPVYDMCSMKRTINARYKYSLWNGKMQNNAKLKG